VDKLERLLNLTAALLQTERPLTADELRHRIDGYPDNLVSFRRAFERDKEDLREMGIPISVEPIPGADPAADGYRIHKRDYYLPDPGLAPDELAALHLAARTVTLEGSSPDEALRKLGGLVAPEPASGSELTSLPADDNLMALFRAVAERRLASFTYRAVSRAVEPYRLDFVRGRWYVTGRDRTRDAERHFRLDRIGSTIQLGPPGGFAAPAEHPAGVRLAPWELGESEPVEARVLVDPDQVPWAEHNLGAPDERRTGGAAIFTVRVTNEDAFRSFVLSFLHHAEVLDPPSCRADLVSWLSAVAGR
jgi:predicted DNA-binding transcriptional regulator YafY